MKILYLFLFWGWQTIRFFNLASSNQTELTGFTLFINILGRSSSFTQLLLPGFERHGLVVNSVQKEVMDDFLEKKSMHHLILMSDWNLNIIFEEIVPAHLLGVALWKGSPEISDTSWKIVSVRGVSFLKPMPTWLYSPPPAWTASPPPPRLPPAGWWRHCPCWEGLWPPGQRWPRCTLLHL